MADAVQNSPEAPKAQDQSSTSQALGEKPQQEPAKAPDPVPAPAPTGGDQKPSEAKPEVKDAPKPEEKKVPEKYELKLPEKALLNPKRVEEIATFAKEQGLSNEQAQKVLEQENSAVSSFVQDQNETMKNKMNSWEGEVKADKEIGGEHFPQTIENARRAVEKFATPEFRKHLEETGLGNHPELVRIFARIGKAMSSDNSIIPGAQGSGKKSIEDIFYPKQ